MSYADAINPAAIEKGIWNALLAIHNQAAELAQVDQGALRNSISIATNKREDKFNKQGEKTLAPADAKITQPTEDYIGKIGTGIVYGPAQEYGLPEKPNYPASPFMRPAAYFGRAKLGGYLTKALKDSIKKMANDRRAKKAKV